MIALVVVAIVAAANQSFFTSIRPGDCAAPPPEIAATYAARHLGVQECPAPRGWRLFVVASDRNTWIDVRSSTVTWSGEDAIAYDAPVGFFPSVGGSPRVEWRRRPDGEIVALIFRVTAQQPSNADRQISRLFVVRFERDRACVLGRVRTNAEARARADSTKHCAGSSQRR